MWLSLTDPGNNTIAVNSDSIVAMRPVAGGTALYFVGMNNAVISEVTQSITTILAMLGGS